jgi:hypothetical protein
MRPLRDVISAESALAGWLERRQRDLAILKLLRKALPPALATQIGVADATCPELLLSARSGAAAALVRHRAPELLQSLTREGWKFTGIRLRVQAHGTRVDRSKFYAKQMDGSAILALRAAADQIEDPRLAAALRRLADRAEPRSKDEQRPLQGIEDEHAQQKK